MIEMYEFSGSYKKQIPFIYTESGQLFQISAVGLDSNANIIFGVNVEGLDSGYDVRYESTNTSVFYVNV